LGFAFIFTQRIPSKFLRGESYGEYPYTPLNNTAIYATYIPELALV